MTIEDPFAEHRPRKGERTAKADFTWCGWEKSLCRPETKDANRQKTLQMKETVWRQINPGGRPWPWQHSAPMHPDWNGPGYVPLSAVVELIRKYQMEKERFRINRERGPVRAAVPTRMLDKQKGTR